MLQVTKPLAFVPYVRKVDKPYKVAEKKGRMVLDRSQGKFLICWMAPIATNQENNEPRYVCEWHNGGLLVKLEVVATDVVGALCTE